MDRRAMVCYVVVLCCVVPCYIDFYCMKQCEVAPLWIDVL